MISHERLSEDPGHDVKLDIYTVKGDEMSNEVVEESYSYVTENMVEKTVSINYDKMMCARRRWLEQNALRA
eukprot:947232-Heterocapsa_arctica.AAC.1